TGHTEIALLCRSKCCVKNLLPHPFPLRPSRPLREASAGEWSGKGGRTHCYASRKGRKGRKGGKDGSKKPFPMHSPSPKRTPPDPYRTPRRYRQTHEFGCLNDCQIFTAACEQF